MKQEENGREAAGCSKQWNSSRRIPVHFAGLAKISQIQRNWQFSLDQIFFAKALFLAKFCIFATHTNFAKLAKFR